jgi:hypothetical protein
MATTAQNARLNPFLYDDALVPVSASGNGGSTATIGDWMAFSAQWAMPAAPGFIGSPAYKVSAAGVAMENNPTFDTLGRAINNTAFLVLRRGVLRVSATASATARTIPMGAHCYPGNTGSGIVGQTAATGAPVCWVTAPAVGISANPTGAIASGVGIVINHPIGGDSGLGQIDVLFNLATNVGYF